jgi:hypothetical protein
MDQAAKDRIQHEIEDEAKKLFPGSLRRVEWLQYGDEPVIEPGELMPRFVFTEPPGRRSWRLERRHASEAFQHGHRPALKKFRHELAERWPEIRHVAVHFEDDSGRGKGGMMRALGDEGRPPDRDSTPVMVRLSAAELKTVDTLITAGIASSRAEAIRWALTRIRARPAYAQLREGTPEIERLKTEF